MATTYQGTYSQETFDGSFSLAGISPYFVALGRICFSLIFIMSGFMHFSQTMVDYATASGVPLASLFVPLTGALAVIGGLSVASGYRARWGAMMLILFLIPVTLIMHNFWTYTEPAMRQMQTVHFMKNLALLGASLFFLYFGSGPVSMDNYLQRRETT